LRPAPDPWLNARMPSILTSLASAVRALSLLATLVALGCGSPSPAPDYPTPEDPPLEDGEEDAVEEEVEDDWVDPSAGEETEEPEKR
jgi:hypothetical protein